MPPRKGSTWSAARRAAFTEETREKLRAASRGRTPWNKGIVQATGLRRRANRLPQERRAEQASKRTT